VEPQNFVFFEFLTEKVTSHLTEVFLLYSQFSNKLIENLQSVNDITILHVFSKVKSGLSQQNGAWKR
jgi:hypothetical protein